MTLVVPTGERERIHALDALRGIALLGILMVNMAAFKGLSVLSNFPRPESLAQPADQYAFLAIATLFWGKFYPIFAFLFGLGFALQMKRIEARGVNPTPVLLRRLLALLGFGLIHGLFIWTGDVLFVYALCGLLLLALRNLAPRTVLYVALGLWGVQVPLALLLSHGMRPPTDGIWWAIAVALTVNGLMVAAWFQTGRWKTRKV